MGLGLGSHNKFSVIYTENVIIGLDPVLFMNAGISEATCSSHSSHMGDNLINRGLLLPYWFQSRRKRVGSKIITSFTRAFRQLHWYNTTTTTSVSVRSSTVMVEETKDNALIIDIKPG